MVTKSGVVYWRTYNNNKFTRVLCMLHLQISPGACRCIVLTSGSFMLLTRHKAVEYLSRNTFITALNQDIHLKSAILPAIWPAA